MVPGCSLLRLCWCFSFKWFPARWIHPLGSSHRSYPKTQRGQPITPLCISVSTSQKLPGKVSPMQVLHAILLTAVTFVPFTSYQYAAYVTFCTSKTTPKAPWCSTFPPSIYTHVQAKYWNIGFLRYWTVSQSPNFLMSAPVLVLLLCFSAYHIRHSFVQGLLKYNQKSPASQTPHATSSPTTRTSSPFLGPSLTPHAIHAFILTSTLIFSAHTQIILRLAASMPFTYWAAAWLFVESENGIRIESEAESTRKETNQKAVAKDRKGVHWGRMWVGWSIVWGAISIVLWTCFLPPA